LCCKHTIRKSLLGRTKPSTGPYAGRRLDTASLDPLGAVIEKTEPLIQSFSVPEGP